MKETAQHFKSFIDDKLPLTVNYVGESFCDETFYFQRQCYECHSLEYIISGTGILHINGKTYEPKDDDIFFLAQSSSHEYYCTKESPWHKIYISFEGNLADEFVKNYLIQDKYVYENTGLHEVFRRIYEISINESYDYRQRNDLILPELMKIFLSIQRSSSVKPLSLAEKIKSTLDMNLQKKYTVNDLSKKLSYTNNHLINVFQKEYGETPYQYLSKRRVELAKEYLKTSSMSVSEIAEMLCYTDAQYFSTCFKRATGMTPSQYRIK